MTKSVIDAALDAAFEHIADRADLMVLCAGAPTSYFEATTLVSSGGKMLASTALSAGLGGGDFTTAAGFASGRRLSVAAQAQIVAAEAGIADHLAIVDQSAGTLLVLTELTETAALGLGEIVALKSFASEITAPV